MWSGAASRAGREGGWILDCGFWIGGVDAIIVHRSRRPIDKARAKSRDKERMRSALDVGS